MSIIFYIDERLVNNFGLKNNKPTFLAKKKGQKRPNLITKNIFDQKLIFLKISNFK